MEKLRNEIEKELLEDILPFWIDHAIDGKNGGFYGKIHNDLHVEENAPKGGVLNARILWTYSAAYKLYGKQEYMDMAKRAYNYIRDFLIDPEFGGIYWSVDYRGNRLETKKQIYAQAFAIYAFSEYYSTFGDEEALSIAVTLYELVEKYSYDPVYKGYFEACSREWQLQNFCLDEKCGKEKKSMNTILHIIEAYTNLYKVWKNEGLRKKLEETVKVTMEHIVDIKTGHFKLFFKENWNNLKMEYSYGHDIEGSWLLCEAAEAVGNSALLIQVEDISKKMAEATLRDGIDTDGSIMYEGGPEGVKDTDRHWWPQAEAVVGFTHAFRLTGDTRFDQAAANVWKFIKENIIDHENGEWFWAVTRDGEILKPDSKVDIWKCPYHNARACMEIIKLDSNWI